MDGEGAEYVKLKVIRVDNNNNREIHFRVKKTTQMKKLKTSYTKMVQVSITSLRFVFNGTTINDEDTPIGLGMKQDDIIEVYPTMYSLLHGLTKEFFKDKKAYYFHYTDDEGAINIIRSGKFLASLKSVGSDDAAYGNGVYLTTLTPETNPKTEIAKNNWGKTSASFLKKTENYFVICIPQSDITDVSDVNGRNIFLYGESNDLRLQKYPWWVKNYDFGKILASYKYKLESMGPASLVPVLGPLFGDYVMTEETVNGRIVYKHETFKAYLFMSSCGRWIVGPRAGKNMGAFVQRSNYSLGPDTNLPWVYWNMEFKKDDSTLKAHPYQV